VLLLPSDHKQGQDASIGCKAPSACTLSFFKGAVADAGDKSSKNITQNYMLAFF